MCINKPQPTNLYTHIYIAADMSHNQSDGSLDTSPLMASNASASELKPLERTKTPRWDAANS